MNNSMPIVSVIIVNFNTRDFLRNCLASIKEKTKSLSHEVIVVDNASSDGSGEMIRIQFPDVLLIEAGENLGFGRANNLAAGKARGAYLFFLNSDTTLCNDAISELFAFMENHQDCGIAGGNLTDFSGNPAHSFNMRFPGPLSDVERLFRRGDDILRHEYNSSDKPRKVAYVTGADLMIARKLFMETGGFDDSFFMYFEETELTHRVSSKGYSVYSVPSARIMHYKGGSLTKLDSVKSIVYESKYIYMRKVYGPFGVAVAHAGFILFCLIKLLTLSLFGKTENAEQYKKILRTENAVYRGLKK